MQSILEALHAGVERASDKPAVILLGDGVQETERLSYGRLQDNARSIAAELQRLGLSGERVLLIYPPGMEFVTALFACFYAGAVAVPVPFLARARAWERVSAIAADAGPRAVLTLSSIAEERARRLAEEDLFWIATDVLPTADSEFSLPAADDLALIQYTSGSTSAPKGVVITHGNIVHNERAIAETFRHGPDLVIANWMPTYHDMGLIGGLMQPIFVGGTSVLLPPLAVLQQPIRWLRAISTYRSATSPAPSFAFDLCARRISPEQREGLDLSCWKVAICGGEPVRARAAAAFVEAFAPYGFSASAFTACFGMAENTLINTAERGRGPFIVKADTAALAAKRFRPASSGQPFSEIVSCGEPVPGVKAAIVDPESRRRLPENQVGEIWLAGGSVAESYWRRPEETEALLRARIVDEPEDAWLRTGDLGFRNADGVFVTGRLKDMLIIRGQNIYPQDVENTVLECSPDLQDGFGAAFSIEKDEEEALVVVVELGRTAATRIDGKAAAGAAITAVSNQFGVRLYDFVLVRPGGVPRTTSGKVRRGRTRELYLRGELPIAPAAEAHPLLGRRLMEKAG